MILVFLNFLMSGRLRWWGIIFGEMEWERVYGVVEVAVYWTNIKMTRFWSSLFTTL